MVQIPLRSGAYSSQSYIANSQRSINLYSEKNPEDTNPVFPVTQYVRPGLTLLASPPQAMAARCLFRSTTGFLFAVLGQKVFYIDQNYVFTQIGSLQANKTTPVYMADNGVSAFVVDGSPQGYVITLPISTAPIPLMVQSADPAFFGSDRVDYIDTFFVFNVPNTNQWYSSLSLSTAFNALFIGVKTAWPDPIQCVVAIERVVYVFGTQKSEAWYNAGTVPFPFQIQPGVIIEQGCVARYSPQKMNENVYWLSQSPEGARIVMTGNQQLVAQRISTHAIEHEFLTYARVDDAIGSVYQIEGHPFYELHFPTADKTWTYDAATGQWFEDNWLDTNGVLHRARNTFTAYCYGLNLALDWANGKLYQIDQGSFTDNGQPIPWIRSFPHFQNELKRINLTTIMADVSTGTQITTPAPVAPPVSATPLLGNQYILDGVYNSLIIFVKPAAALPAVIPPTLTLPEPAVILRTSRDGGNSYDSKRAKGLLGTGHYRTVVRWRGNGLARDWVIELSSTAEMTLALNGVYVDPVPSSS